MITNQACSIHHQSLGAVLPMARVKSRIVPAHGVHAAIERDALQRAGPQSADLRREHATGDVLEIPREGLALQLLPQLPPWLQVPQRGPWWNLQIQSNNKTHHT